MTHDEPLDALDAPLAGVLWVPVAVAGMPLAFKRFVRHRCPQWAAALAYYSIMGTVPVLTALFALAKGAGLHVRLMPFVVNTVGAGSASMAQQVVEFISRTNVRAVGVLSAVGALLAAFGILGNAEMCFNSIWGGVPGRSWRRKLGAFSQVVIGAPLVLLAALTITALLRDGSRTRVVFESLSLGWLVLLVLRGLPYLLLWAGFTALYKRLPNTHVHRRSALVGALVAGTLWQFAQWTYVDFMIRLVRFSSVYGALWQLPILLVWVYVAWLVILFGAEVARAHHEVLVARLTLSRLEAPAPDTARDESLSPPHFP